jgi:hypothetical protein
MVWGGSVLLLFFTLMGVHTYVYHCTRMSEMLSEPQIMTRMRNSEGAIEVVDDYRDVYWCHHMIGSQWVQTPRHGDPISAPPPAFHGGGMAGRRLRERVNPS